MTGEEFYALRDDPILDSVVEHLGIRQNENHLEHHGRLGQRWGVKNGPPYPLNEEGNARFKLRNKNIKAGQRTDIGSGMSQFAGFKNKSGESFDFF